jgi:hypothetical protein
MGSHVVIKIHLSSKPQREPGGREGQSTDWTPDKGPSRDWGVRDRNNSESIAATLSGQGEKAQAQSTSRVVEEARQVLDLPLGL